MNEVAFAGSVSRWIISAEDAQWRVSSDGGIDGERDKAGLRVMPHGQIPVGIGAAGIEIAKHSDPDAVRGGGIFEDLFAE